MSIIATPVPQLWRLAGETNGYLLVRGSHALLIDCPDVDAAALEAAGLPAPGTILHTQVQAEHCREGLHFPHAEVYVAEASREIAVRSARFFADARLIWAEDRNWDTRGEEPYGVAGCLTERPPTLPLPVAGTLAPGDTFTWEDVTLEVVALPGSGKRSIGFYWREENVLFSGDLLHAGGYLVNLYDLERSYGLLTGYEQLRASLATVEGLAPRLLLPSTGPISADPIGDIARLRARIAWLERGPVRRREETAGQTNYTPRRTFRRYKEVADGIYQSANFGNVILYIDADGRGVMIDPDPCVWLSWEESCREVHADLDVFEREAGLRRIEYALITHYHGDHVQFCDLLRARYGTEIVATPDVAAIMERPGQYRYPCTIDWYGFPFDHVTVDRRVAYDAPLDWHGIPITPIHTPGHCCAHTGFVIPWRGRLTICTGDTFQYGVGPIGAGLPVIYNDTAWPDRGMLITYRKLAALRPDLILGGHSHSCIAPQGILEDFIAVTVEGEALGAAMLADGDLLRGMTPPGYDEKR